MTPVFDEYVSSLLLCEADSWISGFVFPDNTVIYSKSNWEHHADLIEKYWKIFAHYFDDEFDAERVQDAIVNSELFLFKNRSICPFIIDGTGIGFDVKPTDQQRKAVEQKRYAIVSNYGSSQGFR